MELNRRNFIKLVVGGVAGVHVTPLPWKLTDDIAIWTQNWPWVPVPPVGAFVHEKSLCKLCPGGCGIEVRKVDERAVKIEGRTDYPVNPGGICPVGMGGLQLLYNEDSRFTRPMKRVGPRGSGTFMDISWDEALTILATRIQDLRKKGVPEAIAAVDGNPTQSTMAVLVERFMQALGSPNYVRVPCAEDTYRMVNLLMQGHEGPVAFDLENADYILSFGSGLLEGWGAPGRVIDAWRLWHEQGAKGRVTTVQVESRASNTASKADRWIAVKPGTDAALALGIAHVIIQEQLYNAAFVENHSFGFNDWRSADGKVHMGFKTLALSKYAPSAVSEMTGLKAGEIVALARAFAGAKAPIALFGKGKGHLNGSLYEFMAIHSLNALVGNVNQPGGVLVHDPLPLAPLTKPERDAISEQGLGKARLDQAKTASYPFSNSLITNLSEAILTGPTSPVDTLLVFSANPAFTLPDGGGFLKAMKRIPFIVSFSPFRDETAFMADLILPDHVYLEKTDDVVWPTGLQYPLYGITKPVVKPVYHTLNSGDVLLDLARRVGGAVASSFPWEKYEAVLETRAKGLFDTEGGLVRFDPVAGPAWKRLSQEGTPKPDYNDFEDMWKKLVSGGLWYRPSHRTGNWERLFKTPTGKFEFFSTQIELAVYESAQKSSEASARKAMGITADGEEAFMAHFEPPVLPGKGEYPMVMVPYELINLASGWIPNPPFLNKTLFDNQLRQDDSFAEINPVDAAKLGLKEGDAAMIQSPRGMARVRVTLFEGAMPGVVFLPLGLGHTAYDEFLRGKGINPNHIIAPAKDPLSGHPIWWHTPVRISKV